MAEPTDRVVRLWSTQTGQLDYTFSRHSKSIHTLTLSADAQLLVSGGDDSAMRFWSRSAEGNYRQTGLVQGYAERILTVAFHPTCPLLISAGDDRMIRIWEMETNQESKQPVQILYGHDAAIRRVVFHPDGQFLASCSFDRTVWIWPLAA